MAREEGRDVGPGPPSRLTTDKEGRTPAGRRGWTRRQAHHQQGGQGRQQLGTTRPRNGNTGYTPSVRTAISVPDPLFHKAEQLARRLGWSRSQLYAQAVRELIARQGDDPVTAALNDLADEMGAETPPSAGRALIQAGAWEW